ncbi:MAG: hypothetical protein ABI792_08595, partial [bacterium]
MLSELSNTNPFGNPKCNLLIFPLLSKFSQQPKSMVLGAIHHLQNVCRHLNLFQHKIYLHPNFQD